MAGDTTFFTNEPGSTLLSRFKKILKDAQCFDVLVGFFRTSGFYHLYKSLESIEKIRILVGLNVDRRTYEIIETARTQGEFDFESHSKTKRLFIEQTASEMENSEDTYETEIGITKFLEFLTTDCPNKDQDIAKGGNGKKLEFRTYPSENIHAKVYISRFSPDHMDFGRVITGSSNFSESGFVANREFNVELKMRTDVKFALEQFEELWKNSVDISKDYVETIQKRTWLNDEISPYHLYLKMLYEYLKEDINADQDIDLNLPEGYFDLIYQKQAVASAKKILDAYNGVFLADVVGLGKTYISALLAQQLPGYKLIICPPVLLEYWDDTFRDFGVTKFRVESLGKLDHILRRDFEKYQYVFIDEAHRFRNEYTQGFEKLHQICFGKKIVLVSATPLNNTFQDIYSQIKLFQIPKKSTIPGVSNLEKFFKKIMQPLKQYKKSDPQYMLLLKEGSKEIREKVLKYIMVRRTRTEIMKYFSEDIEQQGLFFPEVEDPRRIVYQFDDVTGAIFDKTIELLKKFNYSRYLPLLYLRKKISDFDRQSQLNVGGFMKGILVKRLESSFYAFRRTLRRFVESYEKFLDMFQRGTVLISKKINVYELLDEDNDEKIQKLIDEEKLDKYDSVEFREDFILDLQDDLSLLKTIRDLWEDVDSDPKLTQFIYELKSNSELKNEKVVIFSESKETGDYLQEQINKEFPGDVLSYSSHGGIISGQRKAPGFARDLIKANYDPTHKIQNDDIRILVSTEVLAEGINLHRSNIIINYDLPWNPTRVLQRVGRVNRVGAQYPNILVFNFFPTAKSDVHLGLEDNIKAKIQAFHDTLGEDAKYLTEEEILGTYELFGDTLYKKLLNKKTYEGEEEDERSELEYLKFMRSIRDNESHLFEKIKRLPKKARTGRQFEIISDKLITFFRKGKLKKFLMNDGKQSEEISFFDAVDCFECSENTEKKSIPKSYYPMLDISKAKFDLLTTAEDIEPTSSSGGRSNEKYVISRIKVKEFRKFSGFTEEDEEYIRLVLSAYNDGVIPLNTSKKIKKAIEKEKNPLKVLGILKMNIPYNILGVEQAGKPLELIKGEVILSEYLIGKDKS